MMIAETVYNVAICLPEKELEKLYALLGNLNQSHSKNRNPKRPVLISKQESMEYIFRTVFCKSRKL